MALRLDDPCFDCPVDFEEVGLGFGDLGRVAEVGLGEGLVRVEERDERVEGVERGDSRVGGHGGEPVVLVEPVEGL